MTTTITIPHPTIVSRDQWLTERKKPLAHDRAQLRVQELGATNPGEYLNKCREDEQGQFGPRLAC
jgi:hypothetical protein